MANRDVELVIRARNAASGALKEVTAALKELKGVQSDVVGTSKDSDSALGKFADTLKKLTATAQGFDAIGKVAVQVDKATVAIGRMEGDLAKAQAEMVKMTTAAEEAAAANATLSTTATRAKTALEAQKTVVANLAIEQKANAVAVKESSVNLNSLAGQVERLKAPNAALVLTYREQRDLYAELVQHKAALATASDREGRTLVELAAASKSANAAAKESGALERDTAEAAALAKARVDQLNTSLVKSQTELAAVTTELKASAAGLGLATTDTESLATAQTRLAAVITQTTEALKTQKAVRTAGGAQGFTGLAGPGGAVGPASQAVADYRNQQAAVQGAATAFATAREKLTALYAAMVGIREPTAEQTAALLLQRQATEQAEAAWIREAGVMNDLRASIAAQKAARLDLSAALVRGVEQVVSATAAEINADNELVAGLIRARAAEQERIASLGLFSRSILAVREALAQQNAQVGASSTGFQSMAGHIRSLLAVYVGVYQAAHQFSETIKATTDYEAAQIRITTALGQGTEQGAAAFNHAGEAARRLKLDILPTVDSYGLFLASLHGTSIEGPKATKIFDDLLVTIRAFKLGPDAMQRAILALKDMAARGSIARREINQLDQALPVGLLNELARAAGYSSTNLSEFSKQIHGGKVGLDILLPAFDAIAERAKTGLPAALHTAQSSFADFRNAVFDARLAVGQSGLLDAVSQAAQKLSATLRSPDGVNGLKSLGNALAGVVEIMGFFVSHANLLIVAIGAIGGIKMVQLVTSFRTLATVVGTLASVALPGMALGFTRLVASLAAALGASEALAGSMAALLGPAGLAIAVGAIAGGFLLWKTHTNTAQEALTDYEALMRRVADAQGEAAKSGKDWADSINTLSVFEVEKTFNKLNLAVANLNSEFKSMAGELNVIRDSAEGSGNQGLLQEVNHLQSLLTAYQTGVLTVHDFGIALANANKEFKDDQIKSLTASFADFSQRMETTKGQLGDAAQVGLKLGLTIDGMTDAAKNGSGALEAIGKAAHDTSGELDDGETAFEKYTKAIDVLKEKVPALAAEMKKLGEAAKIDADLANAIKAANELPEGLGQRNALNSALDTAALAHVAGSADALAKSLEALSTQTEKSARAIINFEGGLISKAKQDTDGAWIVGFSSKTVTDAAGNVRATRQGDTSNQEEATRDLLRLIDRDLNNIEQAVGSEAFKSLSEEQKAVLSSIAYNYGTLPKAIADAIKAGLPATDVAKIIAGLSANPSRRATEAQVYAQTGSPTSGQVIKDIKEIEKEQEKQKKNEDDINKSVQERIDLLNAEAKGKDVSNKQGYIDKVVQEEINAAKQKGVTLTQQQVEALRKAAALDYDSKHKNEEIDKQKAEALKLVEIVNGLNSQLQTAEKELALATTEHAGDRADEARQKIADLTQQLKEAIPKAHELVDALHDERMTATLDKANLSIQKVHLSTDKLALSINEKLVSGLTDAFQSFFAAVAAGEKPMKALRQAALKFFTDFLSMIAQAILKQLLFNLISKSGIGGGIASALGAIGVSALHSGGIVGPPSGLTRPVSAADWGGRIERYHTGGVIGLGADEALIVAKRNEEMLTQDDPRHRFNGGLSPQKPVINIKQVNAFDATSFLSAALSGTPGEQILLNYFRDNAGAVRAAMGLA